MNVVSNKDRKRKIARDLKLLRQLLALTPPEVVERSGGTLRRPELHKVEKGMSLVSTQAKREALARGLGVPTSVVAAVVEGRMTPEEAVEVARGRSRALPFPDPADAVMRRGENLAILTSLAHVEKSPYPRLELCVLYCEYSGKRWHPAVLAAARGGHFGEDDPTPEQWRVLLDGLERDLETLRARGAEVSAKGEPS